MAAGAASPSFSGEYLTSSSKSSASSHTFSSVGLGDADGNRVIVVGVIQNDSGGVSTISSVTIGGISATNAVNRVDVGVQFRVSIWYAAVPTGTTGDIVVTLGGSDPITVGVWRIIKIGASKAASSTGSNSNTGGSSIAVFATVPVNGFGVVLTTQGNLTNITASGYTEQFDTGNGRNGGNFVVTDTLTSSGIGNGSVIAYASWGP